MMKTLVSGTLLLMRAANTHAQDLPVAGSMLVNGGTSGGNLVVDGGTLGATTAKV